MEYLINRGIKVDAIISDPPYNISYTEWDKNFNIEKAVLLCSKIIKPNGNILLFQGWSNVCQTKSILDKYFQIQNWIIYDRLKGEEQNIILSRQGKIFYGIRTAKNQKPIIKFIQIFLKRQREWEKKTAKKIEH